MTGRLWIGTKRTLGLLRCYFGINFKELEVYDKDFIFGIISMLINYATELLTIILVFEYVHDINGWTLETVLFLFGLNLIGYSLWGCFFINTITLPYYIRNGEFDRFLLRPVEPILQIMMDGFDDDSWGELLMGIIILVYAWLKLGLPAWYAIFVPVITISACFIYAGLSIMLSTVSFFTVAQADVANFTAEVKELAQYPITIYPRIIQFVFTFICPVAFVAFYPGSALFQNKNIWYILLTPVVATVYFKLSKYVWHLGVRHYGGTGS